VRERAWGRENGKNRKNIWCGIQKVNIISLITLEERARRKTRKSFSEFSKTLHNFFFFFFFSFSSFPSSIYKLARFPSFELTSSISSFSSNREVEFGSVINVPQVILRTLSTIRNKVCKLSSLLLRLSSSLFLPPFQISFSAWKRRARVMMVTKLEGLS
jgi:hypothetical protein